MKSTFDTKNLLASAFITTGLLGVSPAICDEISRPETISSREQSVITLGTELCNQRFQCSKTGFIVHFLPNNKALFTHFDSGHILNADYVIHFNRDIAMNVYSNPSKHFDFMLRNIALQDKGFSANLNKEDRYFYKV